MPDMSNVDAPPVPSSPDWDNDWTFRMFRKIELEMSIREMAQHTVAYKTIRRIENNNGGYKPTMKTKRKLARGLNMTLPEIEVLMKNQVNKNQAQGGE